MVTSHFLHAYIVVQPDPGDGGADKYKVSVTARADVPHFGPSLPSPPVFIRGPEFRDWILNKLISAETACYKAERFSKLKQRTQATLLGNLVKDLTSKTEEFVESSEEEIVGTMTKVETSFFKNMKKVISSKPRPESGSGDNNEVQKCNPVARTTSGNSNYESSSNSMNDYDGTISLSTGHSSNSLFSSRGTSPLSNASSSDNNSTDSLENITVQRSSLNGQMNKLQQEVARLKVDKLELLRQNMAAQRELKR